MGERLLVSVRSKLDSVFSKQPRGRSPSVDHTNARASLASSARESSQTWDLSVSPVVSRIIPLADPPLYEGEVIGLVQHGCQATASSIGSLLQGGANKANRRDRKKGYGNLGNGCFWLTDYRIIFTQYRTKESVDVPLGLVQKIEREDLGIVIYLKDSRIFKFFFDGGNLTGSLTGPIPPVDVNNPIDLIDQRNARSTTQQNARTLNVNGSSPLPHSQSLNIDHSNNHHTSTTTNTAPSITTSTISGSPATPRHHSTGSNGGHAPILSQQGSLTQISVGNPNLPGAARATKQWVDGLFSQMQKFAFPGNQLQLFAFRYTLRPPASRSSSSSSSGSSSSSSSGSSSSSSSSSSGSSSSSSSSSSNEDGWTFYNAEQEYQRMGLIGEPGSTGFRMFVNSNYEFCPTYPRIIVVPESISDTDLQAGGPFRSRCRIPAIVYKHPTSHAVLARCAQPMPGIAKKRCAEDEKLLAALRESSVQHKELMHIFDARPYKAAVGNQMMGRGYEDTDSYPNTEMHFCKIDNIHTIRSSLGKFYDAFFTMSSPIPKHEEYQEYHTKLMASDWLFYISLILSNAAKQATFLRDGYSTLSHCSDGWDRTAQLTSLSMLMMDGYYRTRKGFAVLVEQEWCSFGHQFAERYGHADSNHSDAQRAPIFAQWLDTVWQLFRQFPTAFEYSEEFLVFLHSELYSCRFGTFLFDCERERREHQVQQKTISIWTVLCSAENSDVYANPVFDPTTYGRFLIPDCTPHAIVVWERVYVQLTRTRHRDLHKQIASLRKRCLVLEERLRELGAPMVDPLSVSYSEGRGVGLNMAAGIESCFVEGAGGVYLATIAAGGGGGQNGSGDSRAHSGDSRRGSYSEKGGEKSDIHEDKTLSSSSAIKE